MRFAQRRAFTLLTQAVATAVAAGSITVVGGTLAAGPALAGTGYVTVQVDNPTVQTAGGYGAQRAAVSANGRYVAFVSDEPLLPNTNAPANQHVYRYDRQTGTLVQVDVNNSGVGSNGGVPYSGTLQSFGVSISGDGSIVTFHNDASNLDSTAPSYVQCTTGSNGLCNDLGTAGRQWAFYYRQFNSDGTAATHYGAVPVSTASADQWTFKQIDGSVSGDGSRLVWEAQTGSGSTQRVQIWTRPLPSGATTLVSRATGASGTAGNNTTYHLPVAINRTGTVVVFEQKATNLGNSNSGHSIVYVRDLVNNTTEASSTAAIDVHLAGFRGVSDDGTKYLVESTSNLTSTNTGGVNTLYLRNRTSGTWSIATGTAVAVATDPTVSTISADGTKVYFAAPGAIGSGDTNNASDVFVRDLTAGTTTRVSLDSNDAQLSGGSAQPAIDATGAAVAFTYSSGNTNHILLRANVGVTNASFTNVKLTSGDATSGATSVSPGATQIGLSGLNPALLPAATLQQVEGAGLAGIGLAGIGLAGIGLAGIPLNVLYPSGLAGIGLAGIGLAGISLADLPFTHGGLSWDTLLQGTKYQGVPLTDVSLGQVLSLSPAPTGLAGIHLGDIDFSHTSMRSVSIAALGLAGIGIGSLPIKGSTSTAYNDWCAYIAATLNNGQTCSSLGITSSSTLLDVEYAGVSTVASGLAGIGLAGINLAGTGLAGIGLNDLLSGLAGIGLAGIGLAGIGLAGINLTTAGLAGIPLTTLPSSSKLRTIPASSLPSGVVTGQCGNHTCATLGEAIDDNVVSSSATLSTINALLSGFVLGDIGTYGSATIGSLRNALPSSSTVTLGDVLITLLTPAMYPWESAGIPLDGLQDFASSGGLVKYTSSFVISGTGASIPDTTAVVKIPSGFRYVAGSAAFGGPGSTMPGTTDNLVPTSVGNADGTTTLTWHLPFRAPRSDGQAQTITFLARPGLTLAAPQTSTLNLTGQGGGLASPITGSATDAGITIVDNGSPDPATAPVITKDTLIIGHLTKPGQPNYYRIARGAPGTRRSITLSHLPVDDDLVLFNTGTAATTPVGTGIPPVLSGLAGIGLAGIPVQDEGQDTKSGGANAAQAPETLQDVPTSVGPVAGASTHRGTQNEQIDTIVTGGSGYDTIQVSGYGGATSDSPYLLRVRETTPVQVSCPARTFPFSGNSNATSLASVPSGTKTIYLLNSKRFADTYGPAALTTVQNALGNVAGSGAFVDGRGVVLDLSAVSAVTTATAAWDAAPCSVDNANAVAQAVDAVVRNAAAGDSALKNVVIIGGDDQIPMARVPDGTAVANEIDYSSSDKSDNGADNPLTASQAGMNFLTDDVYGDLSPAPFLDHAIFTPQLAVGRLPEGPNEISAALHAYSSSSTHALDPTTAFASGYDFLTDAAQAVDSSLAQRASSHQLLLGNWTAAQLSSALFPNGASPGISAVFAHFDHNRLLSGEGLVSNNDLGTTSMVPTPTNGVGPVTAHLLFSLGCHSGLSVPDPYMNVSGSPSAGGKDWTQSFLGQGAVWVGNTGFGIGDTDSVAYSEQLMSYFAQDLDGSLTVGQALSTAKQRYQGQMGIPSVYDEKVMQEAALYGLPFWKVGSTAPAGGGVAAPPTSPAPPAAGAVLGSPSTDTITGLSSQDVTLTPTFTKHPTAADGTSGRATRGTWWSIGDEVQATHYRALQPKTEVVVTRPGTTVHGGLITALTSNDFRNSDGSGIDPVNVMPTEDQGSLSAEAQSVNQIFPTTFAAITSTEMPYGNEQRLVVVPGQFVADAGKSVGTQRLFTSMTVRTLASSSNDVIPPDLLSISASRSASNVTFKVSAQDRTATGGPANGTVKRILVLYRNPTSSTWSSVDLTHFGSSNDWFAQVAATSDVDWFVQAVDAAGNIATSTSKGTYFHSSTAFSTGIYGAPGSNGYYTGPVTVTVDGPSTPYTVSINGGPAQSASPSFTLPSDGTFDPVVTGSDGIPHALPEIKIDSTAPVITFVGHPNNTFVLNEPTSATVQCTDPNPGSGVQTCPSSATVTTSSVGLHTVNLTATDKAGNTTSGTVTYRVVYSFNGFSGATNAPAFNTASAPGVVLLSFQLLDYSGATQGATLDTSRVSSITTTQINCDGTAMTGATPSSPGLLPVLTNVNGTYQFGWVTDPSYSGTCRRLDVALDDGTTHTVYFHF
ncbi:MAG TPA: PxKF domain-containing protein [Mycobacteriales bacterium]|nr:PxKF domain-containing protein [Mycobacteriales bacterium]